MYIPEDDRRPLFTLTIREFTGILKGIIKEEVEVFSNKTQKGKIDQTEEQDIVGIDKACVIAGIVKSTMYTKVSLKHVPCLTRGKPLRFSKNHLEMWVFAGCPPTNSLKLIEDILREREIEIDECNEP